MKILDTNMILRYLLRDDEQKALFVADILLNSQVYVPIEVFAEVVFVLNGKIYNRSRTEIKDCLTIFLDIIDCENKDNVTLTPKVRVY
jgi:predicted nucleic-acid-binding protein